MPHTQEDKRKTADRGELSAKLWLHMLREGGRWLSGDLAKATDVDPALVGWLLASLGRGGSVHIYEAAGLNRRVKYGVTLACKFPRCVNLGQVAECLAQQPQEEEA